MCYVSVRVTPKHRNINPGYRVEVQIDETKNAKKIVKAQCLDCAASLGGCKHIASFVMWLHCKSEEPAPTEKVCYWKSPFLPMSGRDTNTCWPKILIATSKLCCWIKLLPLKAKKKNNSQWKSILLPMKRTMIQEAQPQAQPHQKMQPISYRMFWHRQKKLAALVYFFLISISQARRFVK